MHGEFKLLTARKKRPPDMSLVSLIRLWVARHRAVVSVSRYSQGAVTLPNIVRSKLRAGSPPAQQPVKKCMSHRTPSHQRSPIGLLRTGYIQRQQDVNHAVFIRIQDDPFPAKVRPTARVRPVIVTNLSSCFEAIFSTEMPKLLTTTYAGINTVLT